MKKADSETRELRQLAVALKSEPEMWTPACLAPEQMIALAEKTVPEADAVSSMAHVALCARCRREYAETIELLELAGEASAPTANRAPLSAANPLSSPPSSAENAAPAGQKEASRPFFWQKWSAPGFGFALGAAVMGLALFGFWNMSARRQRETVASLVKERDTQRLRAERSEQESQTLARELVAQRQKQENDSRFARDVERLKIQIKSQNIQVARLTEAEAALEQTPLPTPGWMHARDSGQVRGSSGSDFRQPQIALVAPVNTAIETRQPTLECRLVSGVTDYHISLEMEGANNEVPAARPLSATRWQLAAPLTPGKVYLWDVTASRGREQLRSRSARFYVLNSAEKETLAVARQRLAQRPFALGMVYARLGMWDQAAQQLQRTLKAAPGQTAARRLLKEITEQRNGN